MDDHLVFYHDFTSLVLSIQDMTNRIIIHYLSGNVDNLRLKSFGLAKHKYV